VFAAGHRIEKGGEGKAHLQADQFAGHVQRGKCDTQAKPIMLPISICSTMTVSPSQEPTGMAGGGGRAGASAMAMARPATRRMRAGKAALLNTGRGGEQGKDSRQRKEEQRKPGIELGRVDRIICSANGVDGPGRTPLSR
jgi:hypothetical protein